MDQTDPNLLKHDYNPSSTGSDIIRTDSEEEKERSSNENICKADADIKANRKKEKDLVAEVDEGSDKKSPEELFIELQRQKTHDLYCPNCKSNITETAKLVEKGKDPHNKQPLVLWIPLVIPKLPSIPLPWSLRNLKDTDGPEPPLDDTPKKQKKHVWDFWPWPNFSFMRFLLIVVPLLLSALLLWFLPSLPHPEFKPHVPGVGKDNEHIPYSPPPPSGDSTQKKEGGWIPFIYSLKEYGIFSQFPSLKLFSTVSLVLLAILAMRWPSNTRRKITKQTSVATKVDVPESQDGKAHVSTNKADDKGQSPDKEIAPKPPKKNKVSPRNKEVDISPAPAPAPTPVVVKPFKFPIPVNPPKILWKHITVSVQKVVQTELDILKSIVYGGLIESITSLGVVSSAAASGASTLNVLALGLANLCSGLFLIIQNLYRLIHEPQSHSDTYQNLLGNRSKRHLHCFVVVVSFIFFGVIPPLVYGLSFKKTDKGHYKAALVLAASLVCVISLSFAKAYAFGEKKLKTVAEYTGMAIGASGLSFIASHFVSDLLEKHGFHELASDYRSA